MMDYLLDLADRPKGHCIRPSSLKVTTIPLLNDSGRKMTSEFVSISDPWKFQERRGPEHG